MTDNQIKYLDKIGCLRLAVIYEKETKGSFDICLEESILSGVLGFRLDFSNTNKLIQMFNLKEWQSQPVFINLQTFEIFDCPFRLNLQFPTFNDTSLSMLLELKELIPRINYITVIGNELELNYY